MAHGIRFVVFMQGCNLRCKYCHNRDTWDTIAEEEFYPKELVKRIKRYRNYIFDAGGVTFTGGEPLLQQEFLLETCKLLKEENIHITIDTSGMVDLTDMLKKLINLCDLFLVDIKHIDNKECKKLTGCGNEKEISFINYLNSINKPIWIRYVLIPGITDKKEYITRLKEYINLLSNIQKVEILPYHNKGMYKWGRLNKKYELENNKEATDEDVKKAYKSLGLT